VGFTAQANREGAAMEAATSIRVMVVDASPVVRAGVAAMLRQADDIDVVAVADDPLHVHPRCREDEIDVVVVNPAVLDAGPGGRTRWLDQLPVSGVVVLTDGVDELLARAVSASGVNACLRLTTVDADELASAVRGVARGQATSSSELVPDLVRRRRGSVHGTHLTAREGDILELLARGRTNDAIATSLGLATGTVRIYVSGILTKLGTPNRTAAAVLAIQEGLVAVP
jgi:DNA-binding NarL/FixJ family response regulator